MVRVKRPNPVGALDKEALLRPHQPGLSIGRGILEGLLLIRDEADLRLVPAGWDGREGRKAQAVVGGAQVKGLVLDDDTQLDVSGVFIETGAKGAVELAATLGVALDSEHFQYIETDKKQQTNIEGLYAAGDICGPPWQMAKAVGEGCVAGLSAAKYVKQFR